MVRWQVCLDVVDERHENVEVRGSHVGLGFNTAALYVVANRLAQTEGTVAPVPRAVGVPLGVSAGRQLARRRAQRHRGARAVGRLTPAGHTTPPAT